MKNHTLYVEAKDSTGAIIYSATVKHGAKTARGFQRVHDRIVWEIFGKYYETKQVTVKTID